MEHEVSNIILRVGHSQIDVSVEAMTFLIMIFLVSCAFFISSKLEKFPKSKIQNIFEIIVEFLNNLATDMIGPKGKEYVPLVGTIFLFVLFSNWLGVIPGGILKLFWMFGIPSIEKEFTLFGVNCMFEEKSGLIFQPPTGNLNTPLALAVSAVVYYNYCGIRALGLKKYLFHYLGPVPEVVKTLVNPLSAGNIVLLVILAPALTALFLFLNILEHFIRVFSLTVRLFCNIMGEHSILAALIAVVTELLATKGSIMSLVIVSPLPLIVMGIGLLTGAIQALIFSILTFSYIAAMAGEHH